ncbi:MAG: MBL fold metallo-hydrolase [Acidimicrobiales bacterium]
MTGEENAASLRVTVLGCSGTHSSAESACSGYLVRSAGATVLYDAGAGISIELQRHVELADLDAVIVSHEHPDHWSELPTLYHAFRYGVGRKHVPTYSTQGVRKLVDAVVPAAREYAFDWTDIDESSVVEIADQRWTFSRTDHPVETLACRVEAGGRSLAISSDTGPEWSPQQFGEPIDLMVYEATLPTHLETSGIPHVSGRQAGERASNVPVGALVLTHVPPGEDADLRFRDAATTYSGPLDLAAPGKTFVA